MTVTELLQHISEGRKVKTERGEFLIGKGFGKGCVVYRGYAYFPNAESSLQILLDEIGEGVWVEEPEPLAMLSKVATKWSNATVIPGYMYRVVYCKAEHIEAFEKHIEAFKGE